MAEVDRKPEWQVYGKRKRRPRGRPKGHRIIVQQSEQITAICLRFGLTGPILTFRDVAQALSKQAGIEIGLGTVHRYAKGQYPRRLELRKAFKLPVEMLAPVCAKCGVVHSRQCRQVPGWVSAAADWLAKRQKESAR